MRGNRLGLYLTARRAQVHPTDVGLPTGDGYRRVEGLRREEVAALAGVSAQYYLRLEQGRDQRPSNQVLDALARALQLDAISTAYLYQLAHTQPPSPESQSGDDIDERTRWLLDSWEKIPAVVHNRYLDVLASNKVARALSPVFVEGNNSLSALLLEPAQREFYEDWTGIAERSIALFRSLVGTDTDAEDQRLNQLVGELSVRSELFRRVWARSEVNYTSTGTHRIRHPRVGNLELHHKNLMMTGSNRHSIFLYHAAPGSISARALDSLTGPSPQH
jgi:transcriptional regulator with XRE-family HTH domain